jgi:hypothetical protein
VSRSEAIRTLIEIGLASKRKRLIAGSDPDALFGVACDTGFDKIFLPAPNELSWTPRLRA